MGCCVGQHDRKENKAIFFACSKIHHIDAMFPGEARNFPPKVNDKLYLEQLSKLDPFLVEHGDVMDKISRGVRNQDGLRCVSCCCEPTSKPRDNLKVPLLPPNLPKVSRPSQSPPPEVTERT